MRRLGLAACALALGCGDDLAVPAPPDAPPPPPCTAVFHGNFEETSRTPDACAQVTSVPRDVALGFTIPVAALGAPLTIAIDLGAQPAPGTYSSETVPAWHARAVEPIDVGLCLYNAGSTEVPRGSFTLALAGIDISAATAHGHLSLTQYVLTWPGTDCGDADTEQLELEF